MGISNNPIVFIACVLGLAFIVTTVWLGFHIARRRLYLAKPNAVDPEQQFMGMIAAPTPLRRHTLTGTYQQQQQMLQHPPVYCVDDLACPPPSYQAVFTRSAAPTPHEMDALRRRLEKLQQRRSRATTSSGGNVACETAIRDSEIRCLAQWIERLEMLRQQEEQHLGRRRTMRLVSSGSEPAALPARMAAEDSTWGHRSVTDPGMIGLARSPRGDVVVAAPPPTPVGSPNPGNVDVRVTVLREQLMRSASGRSYVGQ